MFEIDLDPLELFKEGVAHECDVLAVPVEHGERIKRSGIEVRAWKDAASELHCAGAGSELGGFRSHSVKERND